MTYSAAIARGRGILEWFLVIPGTRYVLGTSPDAPTDAWYTGGGYSYLQGLRRDCIRLACTARPGEVWPDVGSMDLEFQDQLGILGNYLKGWEAVASCELTATLAKGATSANVTTTTDFGATGIVYADHAAWIYSGKTSTTFTGLALTYGSEDVDHVVDTNALPPCQPEITDGPADLRGRRVVLYAAERANGVLSATEQQWIGYVDGFAEITNGMVRIPISHVLKAYRDGLAFGWVPTGRSIGLYVPNFEGCRWGCFRYGASWTDLHIVADGSSQFFESKEALLTAALDPVTGINSLADYTAGLTSDGRVWIQYTGVTEGRFKVDRFLGQLLGFGETEDDSGWLGSEPREARSWPADYFTPLTSVVEDTPPRIYLRTGEASWFDTASVQIDLGDGRDYGIRRVLAVDVVNDYLEISPHSGRGGHPLPDFMLSRSGAAPPTIRQVIDFETSEIHEVVRALWAGEIYAGALSLRFDLPRRWLPSMALRDADADWDQLKRLVESAPWAARRIALRLTGPTEVAEVVVGGLLACGIYAYVKNDGSVGWRAAGIPSELAASTSMGAAWIDGRRCTDAETRVGSDALVNSVQFELRSQDLDQTRKILVVDQKSLQRYGPQVTRDPGDPLAWYTKRAKQIELHAEAGMIESVMDIENDLARHLAGTIFALLSRPRAVVHLPVTPIARQLAIGDAVDLTTAWAWDLAAGEMGVSGKIALILGWIRTEASASADELTVMLIDQPLGAISPAALATSWNALTKKLTVADDDLYHLTADASDLTWFETGDKIQIVEYDATAPLSWVAEIASVDVTAQEIYLTTAPAGLIVPAVVIFDDYTAATADQRGEGWLWVADDADGLIQDLIAGQRWA